MKLLIAARKWSEKKLWVQPRSAMAPNCVPLLISKLFSKWCDFMSSSHPSESPPLLSPVPSSLNSRRWKNETIILDLEWPLTDHTWLGWPLWLMLLVHKRGLLPPRILTPLQSFPFVWIFFQCLLAWFIHTQTKLPPLKSLWPLCSTVRTKKTRVLWDQPEAVIGTVYSHCVSVYLYPFLVCS